jgi:hypothetical protein
MKRGAKTRLRTILVHAVWFFFALVATNAAHAVPSFARQTGMPCTSCHINSFGPKLNEFGRSFKLTGYSLGQSTIPLSGMIQGPSFTHVAKSVDAASENFDTNDNLTVDQLSLFVAGKLFNTSVANAGLFAQITYDSNNNKLGWDNTDLRLARNVTIANEGVNLGISLNNNPTVQDLWNTTPAWGFPFAGTAVPDIPAPMFPTAAPLITSLGAQVGGATVYALIDQWFYVEAGAYTTLSTAAQIALGAGNPTAIQTENQIDGGAPYWRVAIQHNFKNAYLEVGHYGLDADILPQRTRAFGHDHYTDLGLDASFDYRPTGNDDHILQLWGTYIWEDQHLPASANLNFVNNFGEAGPLASNVDNNLYAYHVVGAYTYAQTYQLNFGYFNEHGTFDDLASGGTPPGTEGIVAEFDYTPFGKTDSLWAPYLNARFAVQYTAYSKFAGRSTNYDGLGRNASDNDTLFLNAWFIF